MYRTSSDRYYLNAANRHMETRRRRRRARQWLAHIRFAVEDWFSGWSMP